jgi:hypothetical protein
MSVNNYQPHIIVVAEDDANRDIAHGFIRSSSIPSFNYGKITVLSKKIIGNKAGWQKIIDWFVDNKLQEMKKFKERIIIFLIDFDKKAQGTQDRLAYFKTKIPEDLQERMFLLGSLKEAEDLKRELGANLGENLAKDCKEKTRIYWEHPLLKHNLPELNRMHDIIYPIIFSTLN